MAIKERKQITGTEAQIKGYAGHNGVLAYATDTKHLHVLSGTAGTTTELANRADIPDISGKADKTYVDTELDKKANSSHTHTTAQVTGLDTALAGKAPYSHTHTSAQITDLSNTLAPYAKTTDVNTGLAGKADSYHTHTKSQITDFPSIPDVSTLIPKMGNRGAIAGYELSTEGTTVNDSSPDTQHSTIGDVTVANGSANATWTKVVTMVGGSVLLSGNYWAWSGGKAPELKFPGVLVCHWNGGLPKGIASFISGTS